jgi:plastocyanin
VKRTLPPLLLAAAALWLAAPAAAEVRDYTFRTGPITIAPYEVKQNDLASLGGVPRPPVDGFVTAMEVDIVDANGRPIPIRRLMLHHIVFSYLGRRDATCNRFTLLDSISSVPALAERFYGVGEERNKLALPTGYGYPIRAQNAWLLTWMLMNHRNRVDTGYIQYRVKVDTSPDLTPVVPVWLDVRNCRADPVFNVPGGGRRGSTFSTSSNWTAPYGGRIIAAGGHVHGGGKSLTLSRPRCGSRPVASSKPAWGMPSHPFYNVRPILHEPGPIAMSGWTSQRGIPIAAGETVRLTAQYDNERPHTRVMGIMGAYFARDASVGQPCGPLPTDVRQFQTTQPHRKQPPRFTVPLTGLDRRGVARSISRPPGPTASLRSGATIRVGDNYFTRRNVAVRRGARLIWSFEGNLLHNVTLANGPRGFASPHLNTYRRFSQRFTVPGTYRLFCALHPLSMTGTVQVS